MDEMDPQQIQNNDNNNYKLPQPFYKNIEIISNHASSPTEIQQANYEITSWLNGLSSDVITNVILHGLNYQTTTTTHNSPEFKQVMIHILSTCLCSTTELDALSNETQTRLKSTLLQCYWNENQSEEYITNALANFMIKIFTRFGSTIFVGEAQNEIYALGAGQVLNMVDHNLARNDSEIVLKSLILYKSFLEQLDLIDHKLVGQYSQRLERFFDLTKSERCVTLGIDTLRIIFLKLLTPTADLNARYLQILSFSIGILMLKNYHNAFNSCMNLLHDALEKISTHGFDVNAGFELLLNEHGTIQFIQDVSRSKDVRLQIINFINKLLETKLLKQLHVTSILNSAFALVCEGIKDECSDEKAFALGSLNLEGLLINACRMIEYVANYADKVQNYQTMVSLVDAGFNGGVHEQNASLLTLGLMLESQKEIILDNNKMSEYMSRLLLHFENSRLVTSFGIFALSQCSRHLLPRILAYSKEIVSKLFGHILTTLTNTEEFQIGRAFHFGQSFEAFIIFIQEPAIKTILEKFMRRIVQKSKHTNSVQVQTNCLMILNTLALHGQTVLITFLQHLVSVLEHFLVDPKATANSNFIVCPDEVLSHCLDLMHTLINNWMCSRVHCSFFISVCSANCESRHICQENLNKIYQLITEIVKFNKDLITESSLKLFVGRMLNNLQENIELVSAEADNMVIELAHELSETDVLNEIEEEDEDFPDFDVEMIENPDDELSTDNNNNIGVGEGKNSGVGLIATKMHITSMLVKLHHECLAKFSNELYEEVESGLLAAMKVGSEIVSIHATICHRNLILDKFCSIDAKDKDTMNSTLRLRLSQLIAQHIYNIMTNELDLESLKIGSFKVLQVRLAFIQRALQFCGREVFHAIPGIGDKIMDLLKNVICEERNYCRFPTQYSADLLENEEFMNLVGYLDTMVKTLKYLGMVLPADEFVAYFSTIAAFLISKFEDLNRSFLDKLFIVELGSGVIEVLDPAYIEVFERVLINWFTTLADDLNIPVQHDAIFGLGELARIASPDGVEEIAQYLGQFHSLDPCINDNVTAALAKVVITCPEYHFVPEIIPQIIENLPLKYDLMEYQSILNCLVIIMNDEETRELINNEIHKQHLVETLKHIQEKKEDLIAKEEHVESARIFTYASLVLRHLKCNFSLDLNKIGLNFDQRDKQLQAVVEIEQ